MALEQSNLYLCYGVLIQVIPFSICNVDIIKKWYCNIMILLCVLMLLLVDQKSTFARTAEISTVQSKVDIYTYIYIYFISVILAEYWCFFQDICPSLPMDQHCFQDELGSQAPSLHCPTDYGKTHVTRHWDKTHVSFKTNMLVYILNIESEGPYSLTFTK